MQRPQYPHGHHSKNCSKRLDQEVMHLAMPAYCKVLACLKERREGDGKEGPHDQIAVPRPSEGNRGTKNRKRKGALNIGGGSRHRADRNRAQRDYGYGHDDGQDDPPSNPSHVRH
jgi:hypothetical protein